MKGDANAIAEALAPTLEDFTNDLGQWSEIDADTREYWAKKVQKSANTLNRSLKKVPNDTLTILSMDYMYSCLTQHITGSN